jgi:hypothetical protein
MKPNKVEIVKQVRLTPKQRITLMEMANNGGSKDRIDSDTATVLTHLGLVTKRDRFTAQQKTARLKQRKSMFQECAVLARAWDYDKLRRKVEAIGSDKYHDNETAYFLTPAAQEYLLHGTVTIKTGPTKKAEHGEETA